MKVILLQELKGRGAEGDVVDVARGFAVNYLLPRKVAIEATSGNLKQLEARMHNVRKRDEVRMADATGLVDGLEGKSVGIEAKVGEEGRLYGSITAQMIEDAIREQLGIEVDRRKIETHGHIKELGAHVVEIAIYREVKAHLTVNVVPEGTVHVAPAAEAVVAEEPVVVEVSDDAEADVAYAADEEVAVEDVEIVAAAPEAAEALAEEYSEDE